MIGLCTDSSAQLPPALIERYGVEVVPVTVTVDGVDHEEGVTLDADGFYDLFRSGRRPEVSTSQPSPGRFGVAYAALVERGATEILSVHLGAELSGTLNSARLAAAATTVPVRLVDTGTASFGVGCCVWEAAEALRAGATLEQAAAVAESLAARIGNVFVVGALDLVRAGGRLADTAGDEPAGVPVLTLRDGKVHVVASAANLDEAVDAMAAYARAWGERLRVAIGIADRDGAPVSEALEARLRDATEVYDLVRYRVGPSVGAHSGPGTAGAFFFPAAP